VTEIPQAPIDQLLRLPWTIVRETSPEGDLLLRVAEIPSVVGTGATPSDAEADLWESLRESLKAYAHFGDPIPLPKERSPDWFSAARRFRQVRFVLHVPEHSPTASSEALAPA
jgi:predicted RNase H-like HicB family nuclease